MVILNLQGISFIYAVVVIALGPDLFVSDQLILKGLVGILNSYKKRTKKFNLQYGLWYLRSTCFCSFLEELKTLKSPFEVTDL